MQEPSAERRDTTLLASSFYEPRSLGRLLDVIFYFLAKRLSAPLVIGGDFNDSRLLDEPVPRGNVEFFERVASRGFVELIRKFYSNDETLPGRCLQLNASS